MFPYPRDGRRTTMRQVHVSSGVAWQRVAANADCTAISMCSVRSFSHLRIARVGVQAAEHAKCGRGFQLMLAAVPRQRGVVALNVQLQKQWQEGKQGYYAWSALHGQLCPPAWRGCAKRELCTHESRLLFTRAGSMRHTNRNKLR